MSLRVAFDLDGTLADMHSVLRREALRLFGDSVLPPPSSDVTSTDTADETGSTFTAGLRLTASQRTQLWDQVRQTDNFWTTLPEQEPGIIVRLAEMADARRWEVMFVTTRPSSAGDTTQRQTQQWLVRHGFQLPSVFVVRRSRGKLADALHLDAVVDDRPENCLDVVLDSKARALLIWPGAASDMPLGLSKMGVRAVPNATAALALLARFDDRRRHPKVVQSLRKMLSMDEFDRI